MLNANKCLTSGNVASSFLKTKKWDKQRKTLQEEIACFDCDRTVMSEITYRFEGQHWRSIVLWSPGRRSRVKCSSGRLFLSLLAFMFPSFVGVFDLLQHLTVILICCFVSHLASLSPAALIYGVFPTILRCFARVRSSLAPPGGVLGPGKWKSLLCVCLTTLAFHLSRETIQRTNVKSNLSLKCSRSAPCFRMNEALLCE